VRPLVSLDEFDYRPVQRNLDVAGVGLANDGAVDDIVVCRPASMF